MGALECFLQYPEMFTGMFGLLQALCKQPQMIMRDVLLSNPEDNVPLQFSSTSLSYNLSVASSAMIPEPLGDVLCYKGLICGFILHRHFSALWVIVVNCHAILCPKKLTRPESSMNLLVQIHNSIKNFDFTKTPI